MVTRARVGRREVPRHYWRLDGYPIRVHEDSEPNTHVNLGHDQFRFSVSADALRSMPATIGQGTVVTGYNDQAFCFWEGKLSGPPKYMEDGTASCAAQGHGHSAAKANARLPIRMRDPGVWQDASAMPFNWPSTAQPGITLVHSKDPSDSHQPGNAVDWLDAIAMDLTGGESGGVDCIGAIVMWSPGTTFARLKYGASKALNIYSADGPDIWGTARLEDHSGAGAIHNVHDVTLQRPGDAVVIEFNDTSFDGAGDPSKLVVRPILQGDTAAEFVYAEDIAGAVAARLGWDSSGNGIPGIAAFDNFDRAAGAGEALTTAMGVDDLYWRCLEDRGNGPVLEIGAPSRTWEVSARTGATWNLDELEQYRHVVAQYLTGSKHLAFLSMSAHHESLVLEHVLQRLEGEVLTNLRLDNTLTLSISDVVFDDEHTWLQVYRAMLWALAPRHSGTIQAWDIREAGTGRFAPDEPMPGDLVRITDHSRFASLTLRIADISKGVTKTIGVEAPSLPIGALSAWSGSWSSNRPDQQITGAGAVVTPAGLMSGLPPGAPGVPAGGDKGFEPWQSGGGMGFEPWQ